jgi:hypothetical protein
MHITGQFDSSSKMPSKNQFRRTPFIEIEADLRRSE